MSFRTVSLVLKCSSASSGVIRSSLVGHMGIGPVGKISVALAAISSIGSLTWAVVLFLELYTFGLMPLLFMLKAALGLVAILKSPLISARYGAPFLTNGAPRAGY